MEKQDIKKFLEAHQIEEKIPYFGKARLFQFGLSHQKQNRFFIPKEIFHFLTALYIIDKNVKNRYILRVNTFEKELDEKSFSDLEIKSRINILEDPVFLGQNTIVSIEIILDPDIKEVVMCSVLAEFAKISPDLYQTLHQNDIILVSKQGNKEIHQIRGNAP